MIGKTLAFQFEKGEFRVEKVTFQGNLPGQMGKVVIKRGFFKAAFKKSRDNGGLLRNNFEAC